MQFNKYEQRYDYSGKQILVKQIQLQKSTMASVADIDLEISVLTIDDIKKRATSLAYSMYWESKKQKAMQWMRKQKLKLKSVVYVILFSLFITKRVWAKKNKL